MYILIPRLTLEEYRYYLVLALKISSSKKDFIRLYLDYENFEKYLDEIIRAGKESGDPIINLLSGNDKLLWKLLGNEYDLKNDLEPNVFILVLVLSKLYDKYVIFKSDETLYLYRLLLIISNYKMMIFIFLLKILRSLLILLKIQKISIKT